MIKTRTDHCANPRVGPPPVWGSWEAFPCGPDIAADLTVKGESADVGEEAAQ